MTLTELDTYFRSFLAIDSYPADPSRNGIQIQNSAPDEKRIGKVAFAVDACAETIRRAAAYGADVLFVHHGLFWGQCEPITAQLYRRVKTLLDADTALYACHIPLDANEEVGNNYGLARRIGLEQLEPFGLWRGMSIGVAGCLPEALTAEQLAKKLFPHGEQPLHVLPFGNKRIRTVAIISGGAGDDAEQAAAAGFDAYITGEIGHEQYHFALEAGLTVIAGGHYQTETVGVSLVMKKLGEEKGLETVFIDVPTGL